ncbi:MAG: PilT/PilU family type 4a pilus ATPase [Myxococcota bacterium]|nr:PilT/PilU family type 4a pilus ATPase [Myxococcota bacterium]
MSLLTGMEENEASDVFITEGKPPALRIHGKILPQNLPATDSKTMDGLLQELIHPATLERFKAEGDVDVGITTDDGQRYRLNISKQQGRTNLVARAIPSGALPFHQLGLPKEIQTLANEQRGLILVSGATGSGKSTTLSAIVHHINQNRAAHIVTIEDPIEYVHQDRLSRITQREIGGDTTSFQIALKHVVRQSPDVILIGELRDAETMRVALSAALTGHLVIASLHTIDATQTLQRMLGYFPDERRAQVAMDLSLTLRGIISQRLLPTERGDARAVAVELMTSTPAVIKLLRELRVEELQDLMRSNRQPGLQTFNQSILKLYQAKKINYETGLAYATNPDEFSLQAKGMAAGIASFQSGDSTQAIELDMMALLETVLDRGASDLHLTVGRPPILRVAGSLTPIGNQALSDADMRILLYSILSGRQRSSYELERELDFALALENGRRFRVNAYYQKGRMAAALRAIPAEIPDADSLGLPPGLLKLGTRPHGLLLMVGPTGSGKTTTLACLVDRINRSRPCRIITVEDPIEYAHESIQATIDQREVYADTKSFAAALKYILRQDPDVILIGEMRDMETISAALTAAETGHLVLATLHSNDAIQAIDRIVDVFPSHQQSQARSQLASSVLGIVSQRLLPSKMGSDRLAIFEILVGNAAIRNLIRENKLHQVQSIMEGGRRDGMITLDRALKEAYESGKIHWDDAQRYLQNPKLIPPPDGGTGFSR